MSNHTVKGRKIRVIVLVLCLSLAIISCRNQITSSDKSDDGRMYVDFIDVGKGDCILIRSGGKTFLIDTGYEETVDTVVQYLRTREVSQIDGMILTHFDKDHIGGAKDILKNFTVSQVYMPQYEDTGNKYAKFKEYVDEHMPQIITYVTEDRTIRTGGMEIFINAPKQSTYKQENDYSLVTKITHGEDTYLFAGDAEKKRIKELLEKDFIDADILKLPHHGAIEDNSVQFLEAVSPKYVISTSLTEADTDQMIKDKVTDMGNQNEIFYTCNGTVTCVSDGKRNYEMKGNENKGN